MRKVKEKLQKNKKVTENVPAVESGQNTRPHRVTIIFTALRPFAYAASVTPVVLGASLAWYEGFSIQWGLLALTVLGVLAFHSAANLFNDRIDFERGLDREVQPTSGAVVRGWMSPRRAGGLAWIFIGVGSICGLILVWKAGWPVLLLGILGVLFVLWYTRPNFCLKYAGLGDGAILLTFGLLPVFGAWWVQTRIFNLWPVLWGIPLGLCTVGILHANNWRDFKSDTQKGCQTIASRLGDAGSATYYRLLLLAAFVLVVVLGAISRGKPETLALVFLTLPRALQLIRIGKNKTSQFLMLDGLTAQFQLLFGGLLSLAFILGRVLL